MKRCLNCRVSYNDSESFCVYCGKPLIQFPLQENTMENKTGNLNAGSSSASSSSAAGVIAVVVIILALLALAMSQKLKDDASGRYERGGVDYGANYDWGDDYYWDTNEHKVKRKAW